MSKWICSRKQIVNRARQSLAHRAPVPLRSESYGGEEAAGGVGFFAMAEGQAGVAGGAEVCREESEGSAPAGMDGSDGSFFWIDEQNRNAVCGLHAEQ